VKLDLRVFEEFPAETTLESKAGEFPPFRDDVISVGPVSLDLTIQKSEEEYYCQGAVTADVEVECARCLGNFRTELSGRTDFIITTGAVREGQQAEAEDTEDYVIIDPNTLTADLTDIVRQTLLLELPMKPVCKTDCKGLCSNCGVNLNTAECQCNTERIDPRWEGLKKLKESSKREEEE
jgi:uncharacterized protein